MSFGRSLLTFTPPPLISLPRPSVRPSVPQVTARRRTQTSAAVRTADVCAPTWAPCVNATPALGWTPLARAA